MNRDTIIKYTYHDCIDLAIALSDEYGYKIVGIKNISSSYTNYVHYLVETDEDKYLDIEGIHSKEDLLYNKNIRIEECKYLKQNYKYRDKNAIEVARKLVSLYL